MKTDIFLPKTLKIGLQNRYDTYTGKLAYVTYIDEKGVLRKEKSWNSWRNQDIEPMDIENVPTSGFVLIDILPHLPSSPLEVGDSHFKQGK